MIGPTFLRRRRCSGTKRFFWSHNYAGLTDTRWLTGQNVWAVLDVFRWHLVVGQLLTLRMPHNADAEPWLPVVTAFSHHVIGPHSDELLTDFRGSQDSVTESTFETVTVTANWTDQAVPFMEHTLVPGGVVSVAHDNSVTGGAFERYNGRALSVGEHYLIEQRKQQGVIVRQPMGSDTALAARALPNWREGAAVYVAAFNRHDQLVGREGRRVRNGDVEYLHQSVAASEVQRRTFEVSNALGERNDEDGLHELDLGWTTTVAEVRDGRTCRREVQMTPSEDWGMIAFEVTRDIFGGGGEADVIVEAQWYDEGTGERSLGMVYDGAVLHPEYDHTEPTSGWYPTINDRQWKTARYTCPRAAFP